MDHVVQAASTQANPLQTGKLGKGKIFLGLFGMSFIAFGLGFEDCLFNPETVDSCVAVAEGWVEPFRKVGDHILAWMIGIMNAVF